MADYFSDRYFPPSYFPAGYFEGGQQNPGAMSASLAGAGSAVGTLTATQATAGGRASAASGSGHYRGRRWWEDEQYRPSRKAREWTDKELEELVDAAFLALGINWADPPTTATRKGVRKYVEARSHDLNVLLPAVGDVTAAMRRREGLDADLRTADEEDTLLLLAA